MMLKKNQKIKKTQSPSLLTSDKWIQKKKKIQTQKREDREKIKKYKFKEEETKKKDMKKKEGINQEKTFN